MANEKNLRRGGQPGHKGAGGRPPDWLKLKCEAIIEKKKLIEWLGAVASGEAVDIRVVFDDDNVPHREKLSASIKDRLRAMEMLEDRAWGKPSQAVELSGSIDMNAEEAKRQIAVGVSEFLSSVKPRVV